MQEHAKWHGMNTLEQIRIAAYEAGNHFFDGQLEKIVGGHVSIVVYPTFTREFGTYFVTSSKDWQANRWYTVRQAYFEGPNPSDEKAFRIRAVDIHGDERTYEHFEFYYQAHARAKKLWRRDRDRVSLMRNWPKNQMATEMGGSASKLQRHLAELQATYYLQSLSNS